MLISLVAPPEAVAAQSLLDRPPDLSGTWVGQTGVIYFDLLHRFRSSGGPAEKVINSPTFLLGAPLRPHHGGRPLCHQLVLVTGYPNEWEFFGR